MKKRGNKQEKKMKLMLGFFLFVLFFWFFVFFFPLIIIIFKISALGKGKTKEIKKKILSTSFL